jgi:hypothetical protein
MMVSFLNLSYEIGCPDYFYAFLLNHSRSLNKPHSTPQDISSLCFLRFDLPLWNLKVHYAAVFEFLITVGVVCGM